MNKLKVIFIGFSLSVSASAFAGSDLDTNSYCAGFYNGINEYQPFSGMGKEAKDSFEHFQKEANKIGKINEQEFNEGKSEGLKIWASKANYKKRTKEANKCFDLNTIYVQNMTSDELMEAYK